MKIGIDISQLAYQNTGVANYLGSLVQNLLETDKENEYILFFSSLRRKFHFSFFSDSIGISNGNDDQDNVQPASQRGESNNNVTIKRFRFPPSVLDLLWNRLHILPIEDLIGDVDIFISSDWTQPPTRKARKVTILYDLIVYKHPEETAKKIVDTQKSKLAWVKKEANHILCISEATKRDAMEVLGIEEKRLSVVYPGV